MPNSKWTWSFAGIAIGQACIALALEGYVFASFETSLSPGIPKGTTQAQTIPTYLALFIFGFLYQLVLVWDALRMKNTIQIIGLCLYNLGMLIYAAVQMNQIEDAIQFLQGSGWIRPNEWTKLRPILIAVPCIVALVTVLMSFVAWKLYHEFAWTIYKNISADLQMKRRYLTYQIYIALLKFDFFFFLGFTVQFLVIIGQSFSDAEFYLTIIAVPITVIILFLAAWCTRRETRIGKSQPVHLIRQVIAFANRPNRTSLHHNNLLRSNGLLRLQAGAHVRLQRPIQSQRVPAGSPESHLVRDHHHPVATGYHHNSGTVHEEFRQGLEAAYPEPEGTR